MGTAVGGKGGAGRKGDKPMLYLKKCPKCMGDVYESRDIYQTFLTCAQCGFYLTPEQEAHLRRYGTVETKTAGVKRAGAQRTGS